MEALVLELCLGQFTLAVVLSSVNIKVREWMAFLICVS